MIESTTKQGENEDLETCKIFFLNFLTFGLLWSLATFLP